MEGEKAEITSPIGGKISFFTGKPHDLQKTLDSLRRNGPTAVKQLILLATVSKDEKVQLEASKALLDMSAKISKEISRDQLTRLIGEVKLNSGNVQGMKTIGEDDVEDDAVVDFSSIPSEYQD